MYLSTYFWLNVLVEDSVDMHEPMSLKDIDDAVRPKRNERRFSRLRTMGRGNTVSTKHSNVGDKHSESVHAELWFLSTSTVVKI